MLDKLEKRDVLQYGTPALAFLGDSVYELWIRNMIVLQGNAPSKALHDIKIQYARCEFQSEASDRLKDIFTEDEAGVFRRGKNSKENSIPKHSKGIDYKKATGLECVFGYLYLMGNTSRIDELMKIIVNK